MIKKTIVSTIAFASLAACVNLDGPKPPPTLLTLSSPQPTDQSGRTAPPAGSLTVVVPTVPAVLQPARIPVRISTTQYAYLKGAQWVDTPAHLFQRVLSDTIAARTPLVVLDPRQTTHNPGSRLTGQLVDFGLDVTNPTKPVVRIRYDAMLGAHPSGLIASRRFEVEKAVSNQQPATVSRALDEAANEVAQQVADWIAAR